MNQQVLIQVMDGIYPVDAKIVGKLAVHDWSHSVLENRVSHIQTGCFIAAFTSYSDAINFAKKADKILDFDELAMVMIKDSKKQASIQFKNELDTIKELRESYSSYIPAFQLSIGKTSIKMLKERLNNSQIIHETI